MLLTELLAVLDTLGLIFSLVLRVLIDNGESERAKLKSENKCNKYLFLQGNI